MNNKQRMDRAIELSQEVQSIRERLQQKEREFEQLFETSAKHTKNNQKLCSDCKEKKVIAKGWCSTCYARNRYGKKGGKKPSPSHTSPSSPQVAERIRRNKIIKEWDKRKSDSEPKEERIAITCILCQKKFKDSPEKDMCFECRKVFAGTTSTG